MNNLAYGDVGKTSIATTGYVRREQGSIASDANLEGNNAGLVTVETFFNPAHRLPSSQSIHLSWNSVEIPSFYSGITSGKADVVTYAPFEEGVRGVFTLKHQRTVLFSQEMELHIAELPRRKPRVNFDRRAFDTDDE